jgi:hypothetical protein
MLPRPLPPPPRVPWLLPRMDGLNCPKCSSTKIIRGVDLPFYIKKSILRRQKKNYGNSNISPCQNIIFKKSSKRNQNPSRYYNFVTNLKFQCKPKYHLSKILL